METTGWFKLIFIFIYCSHQSDTISYDVLTNYCSQNNILHFTYLLKAKGSIYVKIYVIVTITRIFSGRVTFLDSIISSEIYHMDLQDESLG